MFRFFGEVEFEVVGEVVVEYKEEVVEECKECEFKGEVGLKENDVAVCG